MRTRRSSARIRDKAVFRYQFGDSSDGEDIDHAGASASRRSKKAQEQDADSSNDEMVMTQDLGDEGDDHHSAYENEEASVGEEVEEEEDDEEEDDDDDEEDEDDDEEEDEDDKEEDEDDKKDDSVAACNVEDATSTRSTPVKAKKKLPRRRSSTKKATVKASTTTPRHKKLASEKASSRSSDRKSNIKTSEDGGYLEIPMATTIYDGVTSKQQPRQTYIGCNDRAVRLHHLVSVWYGPDEELVAKIQEVLDCWFDWPVLPPKARESEVLLHSSSSSTSREKALITDWRESINAAMTSRLPCLRSLSPAEAAPYRLLLAPSHKYNLTDALNHAYTMPVLVGPDEARQEFVLTPGTGHALAQSGIPLDYDESQDKQPSGWMLDTGGIVTSISWAPRTIAAEATQEQEENRDKSETQQQREPQLLAVSVLPHADQDVCQLLTEETTQKEFKAHGIVQLWELYAEPSSSTSPNGATEAACPGSLPPRLCRTLCFPHGRARRVEWNPAGSFLAVLCANGAVYVLDADTPGNEEYELLVNPLAVLQLQNEDCIEATAMSWSNVNRLVLGYSDGSIALWSVFPCHLLSRHAVHHSHVVELATGYPSMPQLVASTPLGGTMRLTDLSEGPSHEFTQAQAINVTTQPGLLAWTDHMLGFFALYPSSRVNNTAVGFMHHANFPLVRTTLAADSLPSAAAAGRTHPFLLVGLLDGSAWCLNPLVEHFNSRSDSTYRIRLLQHEHRPRRLFAGASSAGLRGASRVLQGFVPEKNRSARKEPVAAAKKGKAVKKRVTKRTGEEDGGYTDGDGDDDDDDDDDDEDDDDGHDDAYDEVLRGDASRFAVHEPLTRITAMEWNPNKGYGCWAAMAMASGLVRIMDLGIDEDE